MKHGTQWSASEWLKVAAMAYGLIQQGQKHKDAVVAAQTAVLPRNRWREHSKLVHATAPSMLTWPKYLKQVEAMTPEQRDAILLADAAPPLKGKDPDRVAPPPPAPAPAPVVKARKPYTRKDAATMADKRTEVAEGHVVRWTSNEWALIARAAKWVSEQSPNLALPRQVNEAQVWTLQPHRLRPYSAIAQSYHTRQDGQRVLVRKLAEGLERGWTINTVPFNPPGSEPEKKEELAPPPVVAEPVSQDDSAAVAPVPTQPFPTTGGALPSSSLTEAAKVFGVTMMQALDTLLVSHSQHLLGQVNERVSAMAHDMGAQVAAMIEGAMRRTVHSMVEQELGGPVSPPAAPADEPAPRINGTITLPGEEARRKRVKIDVVGFDPQQYAPIVNGFIDNDAVDVRFIDAEHKTTYSPHRGRHLIMLADRISHTLKAKILAAGIKPVYIPRATAYHITHAIEELQRSAMQ